MSDGSVGLRTSIVDTTTIDFGTAAAWPPGTFGGVSDTSAGWGGGGSSTARSPA
ncbi:MAG: hypothetical protein O9972_26345 [Burkholderiales bacterium]|nr:hypothetical protein [Burkholderiales bacterium]